MLENLFATLIVTLALLFALVALFAGYPEGVGVALIIALAWTPSIFSYKNTIPNLPI